MEKKKISILINSIEAGGAERVVTMLLHRLKNDFDIFLVLLHKSIEYDLPEDQKIFLLDKGAENKGLFKLIKLPFLALRYKKFCKKNNIETSLSFLKRSNYINCLCRMYGLKSKIIISERTYLSFYLKFIGKSNKYIGRFLTKKLYPKADLIIANSALIAYDLAENFKIDTLFTIINNPVNLKFIETGSKESVGSIMIEKFTFISVGGFRPEKNFELLINAFYKIRDLNCNLILVGKGENEKKLRNHVKDLELESKIHFPGFDNNPYKYLSKAGCFVLSSNFEGFPNSVQEALACNLPVIATDCRSGPREILAPDTDIFISLKDRIEVAKYGVLVPVNNCELLSQAMRLIYDDKALRNKLSSTAFERAKDFDIAKIADKFKKVLFD